MEISINSTIESNARIIKRLMIAYFKRMMKTLFIGRRIYPFFIIWYDCEHFQRQEGKKKIQERVSIHYTRNAASKTTQAPRGQRKKKFKWVYFESINNPSLSKKWVTIKKKK